MEEMWIYLAPEKGILSHELVLFYLELFFPGYTKLLFPPDGLHGEEIAYREKGIKEKYPETFNKKMAKVERRRNNSLRNVGEELVPVDIGKQYIGKKKNDLSEDQQEISFLVEELKIQEAAAVKYIYAWQLREEDVRQPDLNTRVKCNPVQRAKKNEDQPYQGVYNN
jgi:hypothetical protein